MLDFPHNILGFLVPFFPMFSCDLTVQKFVYLFYGAIMTKGNRTVCQILRTLGKKDNPSYSLYHQFFNRSSWSGVTGSRIISKLIVSFFSLKEIRLVVDETIERRKGKKIRLKGNYRDACRSCSKKANHCDGIKWLVIAISVHLPFAKRPWALTISSILIPSKEWYKQYKRTKKTNIDRLIQFIKVFRLWFPDKKIILIGDGDFGNVKLAQACLSQNIELIARTRKDANFYEYLPSGKKGKKNPNMLELIRDPKIQWNEVILDWYLKGKKKVKFISGIAVRHVKGTGDIAIKYVITKIPEISKDYIMITSTDINLPDFEVIQMFMERWGIEVTFEEVRRYLGVETQRQWSERALQRETPALFLSYSLVTLMACSFQETNDFSCQHTAWYEKKWPTFSDALACVRYHLWQTEIFKMDKNFQLFNQNKEFKNPEIQEIMGRMLYELSHAA